MQMWFNCVSCSAKNSDYSNLRTPSTNILSSRRARTCGNSQLPYASLNHFLMMHARSRATLKKTQMSRVSARLA
ncbi:hypothetical protein QR98_0054490 [Sarcoptes scabiei]|uniref:Uncharacterized protein n=1 Tax=Sarcoptes scabiei TaxID=52283 RepID=A0A132A7R3_SARSC|nr:hypothetical protein QR98_0054490 [Sarcoptes scabiei]